MNPYLLDVSAAMGAVPPTDPFAAGAAAAGIVPPPQAAPAPAAPLYDGVNSASTDAAPLVIPGVQPAPSLPPAGPPPPPLASPADAPGPGPSPSPEATPAISLARGGGVIPAREASRLGPTQWSALQSGNDAQEQAIGNIAAASMGQAQRDEGVYLQHALEARAREEASQQIAIAREDELRMRAADFDRQARSLTQEKLDPGRFWATKSTPQKVATFISIALGGFLSGSRGGENLAWQRVNEEIERDIDAQKLSIGLKRDRVDAAQTAYGMALQRYQSEDAARSFARVSAMDAVAAEVARQQAQNKGTDVANRAQAALAELAQQRAVQIQQGIAFIPSQVVEPRYRVANRLGTYTAREIDDKQIAPEEARGFELQKIDRTNEGKIRENAAKNSDDREKRWVPTSSTGKGYYAPTEKEGTDHREIQASTQEVLDLVDRIKANSSQLGYTGRVATATGVKTSTAKKVEADTVALVGALNRMNKFGALDKGTQELLGKMTGDPLSVLGNEAQLEAIRVNAVEKRRQIEKSSTGAKPSMVPSGSQGGAGKQAW